ncbi:hypothetical protein DPMN_021676 [Dreissena polymorpha]|uniref:Uncharacterized protein n=1 Tax=Dreissena polymorpha TaxID=45954 RepID=A0A9D4NMK4_DREPO|nr:hypothetical protein DPMN_021676 [Dreissena polymorpha]
MAKWIWCLPSNWMDKGLIPTVGAVVRSPPKMPSTGSTQEMNLRAFQQALGFLCSRHK